jgi:hypothetical protein
MEVFSGYSQYAKNHKGLRRKNYVFFRFSKAKTKCVNLQKVSRSLTKVLTWKEEGSDYDIYQRRYFKVFSFILKLKHHV